MEKIIGIYKITCIPTGKVYIGSSKNIKRRWQKHKEELNKNIHHTPYLQAAWNKYGKDEFHFSIIEQHENYDLKYLYEREFYWMIEYDCKNSEKGFNYCDPGKGPSIPYKDRKKSTGERKKRDSKPVYSLNLETKELKLTTYQACIEENNIKQSRFGDIILFWKKYFNNEIEGMRDKNMKKSYKGFTYIPVDLYSESTDYINIVSQRQWYKEKKTQDILKYHRDYYHKNKLKIN